jgi:hypothetical protein
VNQCGGPEPGQDRTEANRFAGTGAAKIIVIIIEIRTIYKARGLDTETRGGGPHNFPFLESRAGAPSKRCSSVTGSQLLDD